VSLAVLVPGAAGQLGTDLLEVLGGREDVVEVRGLRRADLDITDPAAVAAAVEEWSRAARAGGARPVLINAAAWTDVDGAETAEDAAYAVNATAAGHLADACAQASAQMVQVSTDYVFDGTASEPYPVDAPTAPRSAYGRTKLAGEIAVRERCPSSWVVRTAWVYGATGGNFVKTMARLERSRDTLDVVDDQRGSPTWSRHLAGGLAELAVAQPAYGVLHATGGGQTTWFGLAQAVFAEIGVDPERVRPTTSAAYPRPAPRPAYSVLSESAWRSAGLTPLPHWRDALRAAFATVGPALRG